MHVDIVLVASGAPQILCLGDRRNLAVIIDTDWPPGGFVGMAYTSRRSRTRVTAVSPEALDNAAINGCILMRCASCFWKLDSCLTEAFA